MPVLSIIIPSYNSAEFLPKTIASALAQTMAEVEVIVVDDGSTDSTEAVCRSFGDKIQYLRQENGGVSKARNQGARIAKGEWLLFLDSDDQLLSTAAASLLNASTANSVGVVYGMVIERAEPPKEPRLNGFNYGVGEPPLPAQRNYARSVIITPGSAIVRKSLHEKLGGFVPTFEPMEDRDYWIKCGFLVSFGFSNEVVLDKTWRLASAGSQNARRIWSGLRSRLALKGWCEQHNLELVGLPVDRKKILESALKEAIWFRTGSILPALIAEGRKVGASRWWIWRAQIALLGKSREASPHWFIPLK